MNEEHEIKFEVQGRLFKATHPEKPYLYYLFSHKGTFLYTDGEGGWTTTDWAEDDEQKVEEFVVKKGGVFTIANRLMFVVDTGMSVEQSFIVHRFTDNDEGIW